MNISDKLHTSVFHKVDDLPFSVISLTFPDSLIPYHMGLNVLLPKFQDFYVFVRMLILLL